MKHRLNWSFGEPRTEGGYLLTHFYYQPGRHVELRLPWPAQVFEAAGGLPIQMEIEGEETPAMGLASGSAESGRQLYDRLGKEAQAVLIRAFANLNDAEEERILFLRFSTPQAENRELCLTLEELPWEWLHDGESFLAWRYSLQIVRSHARDLDLFPVRAMSVSSWRILLITPFVDEKGRQGLAPLPAGIHEIRALRELQSHTNGLITVSPAGDSDISPGIKTFSELEKALQDQEHPPYTLMHFVGHGVIYDSEPCLCFETEQGGVDYIPVARLKKLLLSVRETRGMQALPAELFLNACGSSRRGRYSSGFASGLHDLGICVLGYASEIPDDEKPVLAAKAFYQSLCIDQSLQKPDESPSVITAIGYARKVLRHQEPDSASVGSHLRAYISADISFAITGRSFIERTIQSLYSRWAEWMKPMDYTDHLSIHFVLALFFGIMLGFQNLLLILPEVVLIKDLTYQEIVSEIARILLIGPMSFLVAAIWIAWQTQRNHRFLLTHTEQSQLKEAFKWSLRSIPLLLIAGFSFVLLFMYSFSRLDILTAQTVAVSGWVQLPVPNFWFGLNACLGFVLCLVLWLATWVNTQRRITLHSYKSFMALGGLYLFIGVVFLTPLVQDALSGTIRFGLWFICLLIHITAYSMTSVKMLKETAWRASQKRRGPARLSWRKLAPLLGGVALLFFCYFFLEESVRFESHTIQQALRNRWGPYDHLDNGLTEVKTIERALRQRAIQDIPDRTLEAAQEDWLLSVVSADYSLYRAVQEPEADERRRWLTQGKDLLDQARQLHPEVGFEDYWNNIYAMIDMMLANDAADEEHKRKLYLQALSKAQLAVKKDQLNFAYLDTLSRIEAHLANLNRDPGLLMSAATHNREAQWRAFFLRSPRADEVRSSIDRMHEYILQKQKEIMEE